MLIVKDLDKLEQYGFKKLTTPGMYEKVLYGTEERGISLLVNPYDDTYGRNFIVVYASVECTEREFDLDEVGALDTIWDLICDGVVTKVKDESVAV